MAYNDAAHAATVVLWRRNRLEETDDAEVLDVTQPDAFPSGRTLPVS